MKAFLVRGPCGTAETEVAWGWISGNSSSTRSGPRVVDGGGHGALGADDPGRGHEQRRRIAFPGLDRGHRLGRGELEECHLMAAVEDDAVGA